MALPPHEVFIVSAGNEIMINQIRETHVQPFTGPDAARYASGLLRQQHIREAVTKRVNKLITDGQKAVVVSKSIEPARPAGPAKRAL
jgi:hypothetical protein